MAAEGGRCIRSAGGRLRVHLNGAYRVVVCLPLTLQASSSAQATMLSAAIPRRSCRGSANAARKSFCLIYAVHDMVARKRCCYR